MKLTSHERGGRARPGDEEQIEMRESGGERDEADVKRRNAFTGAAGTLSKSRVSSHRWWWPFESLTRLPRAAARNCPHLYSLDRGIAPLCALLVSQVGPAPVSQGVVALPPLAPAQVAPCP